MPIPSSPPTLFSALRALFLHISTQPSDKGTVAPRAFIDKVKELNEHFRSTMHQDAHEFLNFLLNKIVEEIEEDRRSSSTGAADDVSTSMSSKGPATLSSHSGNLPRDATLVHKLFEGVLTSETRCLTCETVSSRDESFLDLSIDIDQNSSVTACLRQFSASEMLCQRNKFFCDSCCYLQEAEKRMKIKELPNILALHLKRFKYQEDSQKYIKLAYRVAFPFELRLFNTVDDIDNADRLYDLFAIIVHIGTGPHHGHYISIIKTMGSWYVFDDDNVQPIPESDIARYYGDSNAGSAYVLYYQAVDIDLAALGLRPASPNPSPSVPSWYSQPEALAYNNNSNHSEASSQRSTSNGNLMHPPGLARPDDTSSERSTPLQTTFIYAPEPARPVPVPRRLFPTPPPLYSHAHSYSHPSSHVEPVPVSESALSGLRQRSKGRFFSAFRGTPAVNSSRATTTTGAIPLPGNAGANGTQWTGTDLLADKARRFSSSVPSLTVERMATSAAEYATRPLPAVPSSTSMTLAQKSNTWFKSRRGLRRGEKARPGGLLLNGSESQRVREQDNGATRSRTLRKRASLSEGHIADGGNALRTSHTQSSHSRSLSHSPSSAQALLISPSSSVGLPRGASEGADARAAVWGGNEGDLRPLRSPVACSRVSTEIREKRVTRRIGLTGPMLDFVRRERS